MTTNLDSVEKAVNKYITGKLAQFRAALENEAERPIGALESNAALILSDLCNFLGLAGCRRAGG